MSLPYSNSFLTSMRQVADPLADNAVSHFLHQGSQGREAGQRIFNILVHNDSPVPDDLPQELKDFFQHSDALPDWVDMALLHEGEQVFSAVGPEIVMLLFCKSLPLAYACGHGAEVLLKTGRLVNPQHSANKFNGLNRRIMETAQFIMNVMAPAAMSGQGKGIVTAQKVRLIHACIRYFIRQSDWNTDELGAPINQEDLAGTLMSFSSTVIDGLQQLNMPLSDRQAEAYFHLWRVVGFIMGVQEELLPGSPSEGRVLTRAILERQMRPSEAGQLLTRSLIDYMAYMMPGTLLDDFPADMIRHLNGDELADSLGVEADNGIFDDVMLFVLRRILGRVDFILDNSDTFNAISRIVSRRLLQGLIFSYNDFKKVQFNIPPDLQTQWQLV